MARGLLQFRAILLLTVADSAPRHFSYREIAAAR
jgi:hypothetical protein